MLMPETEEQEKTNVLASCGGGMAEANVEFPHTHTQKHTHTHGRTDRRTGSLSDTCFAPLRTALHMFCPIDWRIYGLKLANTTRMHKPSEVSNSMKAKILAYSTHPVLCLCVAARYSHYWVQRDMNDNASSVLAIV